MTFSLPLDPDHDAIDGFRLGRALRAAILLFDVRAQAFQHERLVNGPGFRVEPCRTVIQTVVFPLTV